ncbi:GDP-D-glucose phosphorylase 1 [Nesidiocoris tenuis]|uniref:GDP-D-glucose phosphorylase 1 n=1 Tax=Nesidiocoris tenuis TaxID=355587 RepID=A0ABN7B5I0_9HEMI|nr:GDP-D-glucose phosphorylase 1 [Nesidiocoris tenuis]
MKDGLFRYALDIDDSRAIVGERTSYFVQLNVNRAVKKRDPQLMDDIRQPFDGTKFNFTQIAEEEIMFRYRRRCKDETDEDRSDDLIIINVSPLEHGHTLLLPQVDDGLPQILTEYGLTFAIRVVLSSNRPSLRAGFNGLLAYATVNHLHFHAYHLDRMMPLEKHKVNHLSGNVYTLDSHPSKGFAFQIRSASEIDAVVKDVVKVANLFLDERLPHNLYITRGLSFDKCNMSTSKRDCLRIYLWARTPSPGLKDLTAFNPALCELFGHFLVKDPQSFAIIDEHFLETTLTSLTDESYRKALPLVRARLEEDNQ